MITISMSAGKLKFDNIMDDLKRDILGVKTKKFLEEVGERGISVARASVWEYGDYIAFSKEVKGRKVTIVGKDIAPIQRSWYTSEGIKTVEISPILMTEFGSGNYAVNNFDDPRGGQGKFPGQKHAFEGSWWWVGLDNIRHESSGEQPEMPMYKAYMDLMYEVESIARRIYKSE